MIALLVVGVSAIMFAFQYCMRSGWFIDDVNEQGYRQTQLELNIHHASKEIFEDGNQFVTHKSALINSEEDDLDNLNLDIQQDLLDAGNHYLKTYSHTKNKHKRGTKKNKKEVETLLKEIEDLVNILSTDALIADIHYIDLEDLNVNGTE